MMNNVIVLISGEGMTLQAILDNPDINVVGVFSNNGLAKGLIRASSANVPHVDSHQSFRELKEHIDLVGDFKLIVLAGYMKILPAWFIQYYNDMGIPIINIHPSLLPKYKGLHTHKRVCEAGDSMHGFTIHHVTKDLDDGPIIVQYVFAVYYWDTPESLEQKVKQTEQKFYPLAIKQFLKEMS